MVDDEVGWDTAEAVGEALGNDVFGPDAGVGELGLVAGDDPGAIEQVGVEVGSGEAAAVEGREVEDGEFVGVEVAAVGGDEVRQEVRGRRDEGIAVAGRGRQIPVV